ncbi:hypothetical protein [Acidovorax sp. NCPPB 3576]|uniref:hypothetical protein n=1 Tax=Acidovorax sp. NCPPB 3576 TaxID=2940488 RepID=UPI00234BF4F9|nr:hypothetical protein [Acidovorax sp. NCPPB 3576]WCM88737.1 hypothetical protein M5C98_01340 [Acidovorax sp. NCPPB 3576]
MRLMACVIGACAIACIGAALWLLIVTAKYAGSEGYAPHSAAMPGYAAGGLEADGDGIFFPGLLLLAVGVFLGKWAWNLWRQP